MPHFEFPTHSHFFAFEIIRLYDASDGPSINAEPNARYSRHS